MDKHNKSEAQPNIRFFGDKKKKNSLVPKCKANKRKNIRGIRGTAAWGPVWSHLWSQNVTLISFRICILYRYPPSAMPLLSSTTNSPVPIPVHDNMLFQHMTQPQQPITEDRGSYLKDYCGAKDDLDTPFNIKGVALIKGMSVILKKKKLCWSRGVENWKKTKNL